MKSFYGKRQVRRNRKKVSMAAAKSIRNLGFERRQE